VAQTAAQRRSAARIAALTRWANEDPKANAERGQAGLQRRFYDQTDPTLPEAERQRRADCAYRAHMARIRYARTVKAARDTGGPAQ
jgi:hypothetical protein